MRKYFFAGMAKISETKTNYFQGIRIINSDEDCQEIMTDIILHKEKELGVASVILTAFNRID